MSGEYPHLYNDLISGCDRWRIAVRRGVFQGVLSFTVWLHDEGIYNGGRAAWYDCGECRALGLRDDSSTANLMLDLLDNNFLTASPATERLAVELLHRNGYRVPDHALVRIYGEGVREQIAGWDR